MSSNDGDIFDGLTALQLEIRHRPEFRCYELMPRGTIKFIESKACVYDLDCANFFTATPDLFRACFNSLIALSEYAESLGFDPNMLGIVRENKLAIKKALGDKVNDYPILQHILRNTA